MLWQKKLKLEVIFFTIISSVVMFGFYHEKQSSEELRNDKSQKPNIVMIVSDDQGYADAGFQEYHPEQVSTPGIDHLAKEGIIFTNAYASGYVCAPTRAGLLTGRYQQRFGFYRASDSRQGLPLSEKTLAEFLKEEEYVTGIFGKWHLGLDDEYRPLQRGFDEFYGFLGHGAHDYFDLRCQSDRKHNCIYRNNEIIEDEGYLTDILAHESCDFIRRHANGSKPFFLYVPFNAVHWPLQAPEPDIALFNTGDKNRNIALAMLRRMDIAVNRIIEMLKTTRQYENTLIFYFSDNGGAKRNHASNAPLRDYKHSTYEGGIRVPFIISWPGRFDPGVCDEPIITIDVLPTIMDILETDLPDDRVFDGKSILPVMNGELDGPLHDQLFFDGNEGKWAVRERNYKLVKNGNGDLELYDVEHDIHESSNIISSHWKTAEHLEKCYYKWKNEMGKPMSGNEKYD